MVVVLMLASVLGLIVGALMAQWLADERYFRQRQRQLDADLDQLLAALSPAELKSQERI